MSASFKIENGVITDSYCSGEKHLEIPSADQSGNPVTEIRHLDESTICREFTRVSIPNSIKVIGEGVFSSSQLSRIAIPASVEHIAEGFAAYSPLTEIVVDPKNPYYESPNGCNAIIDKRTHTLIQGCVNTIIPEGVQVIGKSAFQGCGFRFKGFRSVVLPESVTKISQAAFYDCANLEQILIPKGVTEIGKSAFSDCGRLKTILLPDGLKSIGQQAFENNDDLEYIRIPEAKLEKDVFYYVLNPQIVIATTPAMASMLKKDYADLLRDATFVC